jgi:hypothetical protein
MNLGIPSSVAGAQDEIASLIEILRATDQRLEELTAGEVDSVASRDGRTFLMRTAQARLRATETAKQVAILNAIPAHIALLDTRGVIIAVNRAWSDFTTESASTTWRSATGPSEVIVQMLTSPHPASARCSTVQSQTIHWAMPAIRRPSSAGIRCR